MTKSIFEMLYYQSHRDDNADSPATRLKNDLYLKHNTLKSERESSEKMKKQNALRRNKDIGLKY